MVGIVNQYYQQNVEEESDYYDRFITHLKFLGQRLFGGKIGDKEEKEDELCDMICAKYHEDYLCAQQIKEFIEDTFQKKIPKNEIMYLTIHLKRITMSLD